MIQQEIEYFWPLTQQTNLDLDFSPCEKYNQEKIKNSTYIGNRIDQWSIMPNGAQLCTITNQKLTIDVDQTPITIRSTEKPNFIKRYIYKTLGMEWESKC